MIPSEGENFFTKDPVPSKMESFEFRRTESNKELFRRLYGKNHVTFRKKRRNVIIQISRMEKRRKRIFGEGLRQKFSTKNLLPTRSIPYSPRSPPDSPNDLISRKISLDLAGEWGGRRETSLNRDGSVVGVGLELSYEVAVPIRY